MKYLNIFLAIVAGTAAYAESRIVVMPQNWNPDIDIQMISELSEEALKGPSGDMPQQGLNRYLAILADLWDSKLLSAYIRLSAQLSAPEKEALAKEQQKWLSKRESDSREAGKSEAGGSAAPAAYSQTYIESTQDRFKDISKRLEQAKESVP